MSMVPEENVEISEKKAEKIKEFKEKSNSNSYIFKTIIISLIIFFIISFLYLAYHFIQNSKNKDTKIINIENQLKNLYNRLNGLNDIINSTISEQNKKNNDTRLNNIENQVVNVNNKLKVINDTINSINNKIDLKVNTSNSNIIELQKNDGNFLINQSILEQYYFCKYPSKYYNDEYEKLITLVNANYNNNIKFDIYAFKKNDYISNYLFKYKKWEGNNVDNLVKASDVYAKKYNITKRKDITILDIGANIGTISFALGSLGFHVIGFEPDNRNMYLLKKSFCLNQNQNVIFINKGLYTEEKTFNMYQPSSNKGNGLISDKETNKIAYFEKTNQKVETVKLSRFYDYLKDKKISAIKIDIEGSEEKALSSGIDLITKYHIPFIQLEFTPNLLKQHNTDPEKFYNFFIENGYKIFKNGFFTNQTLLYNSIDKYGLTDIFIVHKSMLE